MIVILTIDFESFWNRIAKILFYTYIIGIYLKK
jgi:hypothetical protein